MNTLLPPIINWFDPFILSYITVDDPITSVGVAVLIVGIILMYLYLSKFVGQNDDSSYNRRCDDREFVQNVQPGESCENEETDVDFFPISDYNEENTTNCEVGERAVELLIACGVGKKESQKRVYEALRDNPGLTLNEVLKKCLK